MQKRDPVIFRYLLLPSLGLMGLGLFVLVLPKGLVPGAIVAAAWAVLVSGIILVGLLVLLAWRAATRQLHALTLTAMRVAQGRKVGVVTMDHPFLQLRALCKLQAALNAVVGRAQDTQLRVNRLAFFDPLTGLANRECFRRRAQAFLDSAKPGNEAALLLVDLDGFKTVNAAMGHDVGDDLLGQAGARLRDMVQGGGLSPKRPILINCRSDATVARVGGDVFGVFLPHTDTSTALSLAERARRRLGAPFPLGSESMMLGASIGLATVPNDSLEFSGVLRAAEVALQTAKRRGKNRVCIAGAGGGADTYGAGAVLPVTGQSQVPRFRPIFRARDLEFAGVEALIDAPLQGGSLDAQLDALCELGLLHKVHHEAFDNVMDAMRNVTRKGINPGHLFQRLPIALLLEDAFMSGVIDLLPLPFDLSFIVFETPGSPSETVEVGWAIDRLSDAGVEIVLDNFGSQQGALTAMVEFAPHLARFDPRLTRAVAESDGLADLTRALVRMVHAADVGAIAQGVQTRAEAVSLTQLGFDYLQGPCFGAALTVEDLVEQLRPPKVGGVSERLQKLQESSA